MRMFDDDTQHQVFQVCVLLTPEEILQLSGFFEWCLEENPGGYHEHIHDDQDPDKPWKSRQMRAITGVLYERIDPQGQGWKGAYLELIEDDAGVMKTVDFERRS